MKYLAKHCCFFLSIVIKETKFILKILSLIITLYMLNKIIFYFKLKKKKKKKKVTAYINIYIQSCILFIYIYIYLYL